MRLTLLRITRAHEWFLHEDEAREKHVRLICYYGANHKARKPTDMWMTYNETVQYHKDIISGKIPTARFRKLTPEEIKNWRNN